MKISSSFTLFSIEELTLRSAAVLVTFCTLWPTITCSQELPILVTVLPDNGASVTPETREAVKQALKGTDYSEGALFFIQKSAAEEHNVKWFEKDLKRLFKYGVHEFYTYK